MSTAKRVSRFYCDYCGKGFWKRRLADNHEPHCWRLDTRTPWLGELSSVYSTGRWGPGGCYESPGWRSVTPPPWFPGLGKLYTESGWVDVPGYRCEETGEGDQVDVWPLWMSEPLNKLPREVRLDWYAMEVDRVSS